MSTPAPSLPSPILHGRVALSIAQVAELTGLSVKTIRRRIADGTLPAVKVGPRTIRIDPADVEALLSPVTSTAGPPPGARRLSRTRSGGAGR